MYLVSFFAIYFIFYLGSSVPRQPRVFYWLDYDAADTS